MQNTLHLSHIQYTETYSDPAILYHPPSLPDDNVPEVGAHETGLVPLYLPVLDCCIVELQGGEELPLPLSSNLKVVRSWRGPVMGRGTHKVVQLHSLVGGSAVLVLRGVLADPKVDVPRQSLWQSQTTPYRVKRD